MKFLFGTVFLVASGVLLFEVVEWQAALVIILLITGNNLLIDHVFVKKKDL